MNWIGLLNRDLIHVANNLGHALLDAVSLGRSRQRESQTGSNMTLSIMLEPGLDCHKSNFFTGPIGHAVHA